MKKPKIIWIQGVSCNGNSHSFFNHPELFEILSNFELIYHPIIESDYSLQDVCKLELDCDILIIEGSYKANLSKYGLDISKTILFYAQKASKIITTGTCASFGGMFAQYDRELSGFCFDGDRATSNYESFKDKLIVLSGCPIHPKWLSFVLLMIVQGRDILIDELHRPQELYGFTVHSGCVRNEYFEWKIDVDGFGKKEGCLFYENGCQAPFTKGSCNRILWHDISSKTMAGTPCLGCTEPSFPKTNLFSTKTNMGIPADMPLGISKRAYLTLTGIAKSFKIKRFEERVVDYEDRKNHRED
jgi:hydrogenase small subunit